MSYSHTLNIENHSHIIGRQDGVTGDSIKANDKVVFCTACQSVFLKESWEYMNGKHCNQFRTLRFMPEPTQMLIIRNGIKVKEEIIFELKDEFLSQINNLINVIVPYAIRYLSLLIASIVIILMWIFIPSDAYNGQKTEYTTFLSLIILFISHYFEPMWIKTKSEEIEDLDFINTSLLKISEKGIILGKNLHYYEQIERITTSKVNNKHEFIIELKDKSRVTKQLSFKKYRHIRQFYLALAWSAQFVEVNFETENKREYELVKKIQEDYEGNIFITGRSIY